MANLNHYHTLRVSATATHAEIKQAYRRLVKLFHPDSNPETADAEEIIRINAAYEVLGDPQRRASYDKERFYWERKKSGMEATVGRGDRQQRTADAQTEYRQYRQTTGDRDEQLQTWLKQVYQPVNNILCRILYSLNDEIDELSADPFDDELMTNFQDYLQTCRDFLSQAQASFRSMPNPSNFAGVAAHLYYCLARVGDGIDELEFFTLNYDEHYLHTGQELFRIAAGLRTQAQAAIRETFY